ncbi:hypothetical protein WA026_007622 [Henosepilachna vigintioctopunctata]|uniref:REST corepressor n=1 Tax=Henosepilachna vigintioctopunctata TaxID=420089 RepID=A0AAW1U3L8_9CUCU
MNSNMASTEQEDYIVENNNHEICDSEHENPAKKPVHSAALRIGEEYQANIPELVTARNADLLEDKGLLIWSPPEDTDDENVDEYLNRATETYGYTAEQSLGMLYWHGHDTEKATEDLANYIPNKLSWSMKEEIVFENAFEQYGKDFKKINELLPHKTKGELINFYYKWKKTLRGSYVKKQEKPKENISPKTPKNKRGPKTKRNKTHSPDNMVISD